MQKKDEELRSHIRERLLRRTQILRLPEKERQQKIRQTVDAVWDDFRQILSSGLTDHKVLQNAVNTTLPWDDYLEKTGIALSDDQKQRQRQLPKDIGMNPFVTKLGLAPTLQLIKKTLIELHQTHPQIDKIISVGSGSGSLESMMESIIKKENLGMTMICIDPDPHTFIPNARVKREPDYSTVDRYLATKPSHVSHSLLFLNWPEVRKEHGAGYDLDAIQKLNPEAVLLLIELDYSKSGAAGSKELHAYRDSPDNPYIKKVISSFSHFVPSEYQMYSLLTHPRIAKLMATRHFIMELWIKQPIPPGLVSCITDVYFAHAHHIDPASFLALVYQVGGQSLLRDIHKMVNVIYQV